METYVLRVEDAPAGAAGAQITLVHWSAPGGPSEIARGLSPMSLGTFTPQGIRDKVIPGQPDDPELSAVGQQLYEMLAVGPVAAPLEDLITGNEAARVVLDVRPAAWQELPWELARLGARTLFGAAEDALVPRPVETDRCALRARMAPAHPHRRWVQAGDSTVQAENEVREIFRALEPAEDHVDVLIKRQPGREQLQRLLSAADGPQPHIFHYIGHGGVQAGVAGGAAGKTWLRIYNCPTPDCGTGVEEDWTEFEISHVLDTGHKPNLVILNACRSASFAQHGLSSLSMKLIEAGVPAVLGMRAEVGPDDAIKFSAAFYGALAGGQPLDAAVAAARSAILGATQNPDERPEWAAPILQLRGTASDLIALPAAPQPAIPASREFDKLRLAVDRRPDRFNAWRKLHGQGRHVFALVGPREIGKTWFAKIVMARCCLAGWRVRYIDLTESATLRPLDLLDRIANGDGSGAPLARPLDPPALFEAFRQQLQEDRVSAESVGSDTDKLNAYERIFKEFRDGLAQSAALQPLVIVIDFKALAREDNDRWHFERVLAPKLFNWVAERQEHDIALVLVARSEDYAWLLERGLALAEECAVQGFPGNEYEELAWEWVRRNLPPPANPHEAEEKLRMRIELEKQQSIGAVWTPEDFEGVRWHAKKAGYDVRK